MSLTQYNQVRQKGSHNSYQRSEGYPDQALYWRIRSLEIDIHNSNNMLGWPALNSDWYVYHAALDSDSSVNTLSDALDVLKAFHQAVPEHEVITVWLDLKDSFQQSTNQTPESLDVLLASKLGRSNIWGPPDLIGDAANLQAAVDTYSWPTLESLRGKFIFACTTGNLNSPDSHLNQYVNNGLTANQRLAFVAPEITRSSDITAHDYAVIFNLDSSHSSLGQDVLDAGFISRAYGLDSQSKWCAAWNSAVHHLTTNKVNAYTDGWARTDLPETGYPFTGIDVTLDRHLTEPGDLYAIKVDSGDVWGKDDSCFFQCDDQTAAPDRNMDAFVGNPESHVNGWIKAGLMARQSLSPSAGYVAILRTGRHGIRMQFRNRDGNSTDAIDAQINDGVNGRPVVSANTPIWLRLSITDQGRVVNGSYSIDGSHWHYVGQCEQQAPAVFQGWVASSHADGEIKWLFGGMQPPKAGHTIGQSASGLFIPDAAQAASLGPKSSSDCCNNS